MVPDVRDALDETPNKAPARCDSRDSCDLQHTKSRKSRESQSQPDECEGKRMMLVTVRPGPVLHVWHDGEQVAEAPLTRHAALCLAADLLRAVQALNFKEHS